MMASESWVFLVRDVVTTQPTERFEIALNTPAGRLTTAVDVPTSFVPVTAIVPLMRRLGEEAQALEEAQASVEGKTRSCKKGCAACCRVLVPLSAPEACALMEFIRTLPSEQQRRIVTRFAQAKSVLLSHGMWERLLEIGESSQTLDDDVLEPINQDYYALRMPCPFLEDEMCSIYDERPAACRELLVTSPPERCQDMVKNAVAPIPVPVRVGSVLGLLWAELTKTPPRLIPLPIVSEWVERHEIENRGTWPGDRLLDSTLDKVWRFLSRAFQQAGGKPMGGG
jgi:Fe-S-cluster containining protein